MPKRIDRVDVRVGSRIRAYRRSLGMSQTALGNKVGVTFQQIQKYENGINRIGSGRLSNIAAALGVDVAALFAGASGKNRTAQHALAAILRQPYAARLVKAFGAIANAKQRLALVTLAESMGESSE
ncbi:MAG TPA: helix-turn-helix transcriptional regulator [Xanthobacteraceae bacterium]|nr:helix-turn-helix transcriptional regulator [Xanthobacteraceae bacterium]